jgi:hypothetical protein
MILAALVSLVALTACKKEVTPVPEPKNEPTAGEDLPPAPPPTYAFDSLDRRSVSSEAFAGKPTIIAFVTTYDVLSQGQVDFLIAMAKHDADRVNYAVVALQNGEERELVETYRDTLGITFPVALGDAATISGKGPLGDVHQVPTTLVFDAAGHEVWRKTGIARSEELRAALKH